MDEGLLNDLLECSVCLERLDTSSRVLPCQHTFCLKCLKVIVESHKELRCPECRVLVEAKVEELPPNVLLMRILEGMKNSAPRNAATRSAYRREHAQVALPGGQPHKEKQLPPHARAMYDYISKESGDLSFKKGETILLVKKLDAFWYQGEINGRSGMFPITYVQVVVPLPVPAALCKALYDFRMSAPDEEGCLAFDKGAIISVHRRVDDNWAEGRLDQRVGIFPIAFVELNQPARQLMNSAPLNRPVPALPSQARPDHRHHAQHSHRYQMSMSTPSAQGQYPSPAAMSHSHPALRPAPPHPAPAPAHKHLDLVHVQRATAALAHGPVAVEHDRRGHKSVKFDYNSTPIHKLDTTYQNIRTEHFPVSIATFNNVSSDSSSSMNTASVGSTTTPNSSNTSSSESNPSLPSSPDNGTDQNATLVTNQEEDATVENLDASLDTSMGVLSLNESSTATNTSLNVSLPAESTQDTVEPTERLDIPSSSVNKLVGRSSGPDSLLNFGIGLQAALSPSHGEYLSRRERDKRHSLTPTTHLQQGHVTQNRHSAEIVATSLLDGGGAGGVGSTRRRRARSSERALPAAYIALYPYKPHKPDELELRKGAVYTVTERCRDGWYKGWSERSQRCGVFPGNYVAPCPADKSVAPAKSAKPAPLVAPLVAPLITNTAAPPDAPPRANSPTGQPLSYPWSHAPPQQAAPRPDKLKEKSKAEKSSISSGVSLMKRLAAMKKCKSPPPAYSMDNPVFEDSPGPSLPAPHASQHVRSGSCPSQLLRTLPASERLRHKERPSLRNLQPEHRTGGSGGGEGVCVATHRKSHSLDVGNTRRGRDYAPLKERFRCVVPYPPNSELELELKLDDVVVVSRKRGDGWYKGTLQRTGRTGLFPASFVQRCPSE